MKQIIETKKFIQILHRLWLADSMDMDDFMTCLEALMMKHGVTWKAFIELEGELMARAISFDFNIDSVFEYEVNDRSKDVYENFERVCFSLMDFTKMYSLLTKAA